MVALENAGLLPPSALRFTPLMIWLYNALALTLAIVLQHQVTVALRGSLNRAEAEIIARHRTEQRLRTALSAGHVGVWEQDLDVESPIRVSCDEASICRVLENLVSNAIKHTQQGSNIRSC